jgi:hypothetical protein
MNIVPLRRFLYLDTKMLDENIAILEGGLTVGPSSVKEIAESIKSGKAGLDFSGIQAGGELGTKGTTETHRVLVEPDALRFQRLYASIEAEGGMAYLEVADDGLWNKLRRHSIVEVVGRIRLTDLQQLYEAVDQISSFLPIFEQFGHLADTEVRTRIGAFQQLRAATKDKGTVVVLDVLGTPEYRFVSTLSDEMLRVAKAEIDGEVTLFGSIQRKLQPGEKLPLGSLLPNFPSLANSATSNRAQKRASARAKAKNRNLSPSQPLLEEIAAPACIVTPVAIFK